jgi:hypothetical protein
MNINSINAIGDALAVIGTLNPDEPSDRLVLFNITRRIGEHIGEHSPDEARPTLQRLVMGAILAGFNRRDVAGTMDSHLTQGVQAGLAVNQEEKS